MGVGKKSSGKSAQSSVSEHIATKSEATTHNVPDSILAKLHPLEIKVLPHLKDDLSISDLCAAAIMQEVDVMRAAQWLETKGALKIDAVTRTEIILAANAQTSLAHGMPEARFLRAVQGSHTTRDAIIKAAHLDAQECDASVGVLKKQGLVEMNKDGKITLTAAGKKAKPENPEIAVLKRIEHGVALNTLQEKEQKIVAELKNRKEYVALKERKAARSSRPTSPSSPSPTRSRARTSSPARGGARRTDHSM